MSGDRIPRSPARARGCRAALRAIRDAGARRCAVDFPSLFASSSSSSTLEAFSFRRRPGASLASVGSSSSEACCMARCRSSATVRSAGARPSTVAPSTDTRRHEARSSDWSTRWTVELVRIASLRYSPAVTHRHQTSTRPCRRFAGEKSPARACGVTWWHITTIERLRGVADDCSETSLTFASHRARVTVTASGARWPVRRPVRSIRRRCGRVNREVRSARRHSVAPVAPRRPPALTGSRG